MVMCVVQVTDDWVVLANLTGSQLDLTSRESQPDTEQAVAGGVAEGYLTYHLILSHYQARVDRDLCQPHPEFCQFCREVFQQKLDLVESLVARWGSQASYYKMVDLFYKQLEGLGLGLMLRAEEEEESLTLPSYLDLTWFAHFLNFYPDLAGLAASFRAERGAEAEASPEFWRLETSVELRTSSGLLADTLTTWLATDYQNQQAPPQRLMKRYNLNYHYVSSDQVVVVGHTIAMTSYPATINSQDHFYLLSSGLTALTTDLGQPDLETDRSELWSGLRAMVANRLGRDGEQWCSLFSHNSGQPGHHTSQWAVLDYRRVRAGYSSHQVVWLSQQQGGHTNTQDITPQLNTRKYWTSNTSNTSLSPTEHLGPLVMSSSADPPLSFRTDRGQIVWGDRLLEISGAGGQEEHSWLGISILNIIVFTGMSILLFFPVNTNNNNINNEDWGYWLND